MVAMVTSYFILGQIIVKLCIEYEGCVTNFVRLHSRGITYIGTSWQCVVLCMWSYMGLYNSYVGKLMS